MRLDSLAYIVLLHGMGLACRGKVLDSQHLSWSDKFVAKSNLYLQPMGGAAELKVSPRRYYLTVTLVDGQP
ncbi:hypothetical protein EV424DRAFT_1396888 [Suillus variegatus]|nr:hypothetical protein EV424DRAFT_1396888 [Suillus variegatus]